ncbi:unnamed protein product [Knipowitschia caucasica]
MVATPASAHLPQAEGYTDRAEVVKQCGALQSRDQSCRLRTLLLLPVTSLRLREQHGADYNTLMTGLSKLPAGVDNTMSRRKPTHPYKVNWR